MSKAASGWTGVAKEISWRAGRTEIIDGAPFHIHDAVRTEIVALPGRGKRVTVVEAFAAWEEQEICILNKARTALPI